MPPPVVLPQPFSSPSIAAAVVPSPSSVLSPSIHASSGPTNAYAVVVDPSPHERPMIKPYGKG